MAVLAVHAGLALGLLHLSGTVDLTQAQDGLEVFDLEEVEPVPPPPPPTPPEQPRPEQPKEKEGGGSSPENIRSEASPIVAPPPTIQIPVPPPIAASETPRQGTSPTQGASDVRGPGTGAGGTGTGTGGGTGSGDGSGGRGGLAAVRTQLATPTLRGRDFPRAILDSWPPGAWAFMRFRVDAEGNITQCIMDRGTGNPATDSQVCAIAQRRLRFRPALDRSGRRVADWAGYGQEPPR